MLMGCTRFRIFISKFDINIERAAHPQCEGFAAEIEHDLEEASKISVHVLSHPQRSRRDFHQSNSQAIEGCTPSPDPSFLDVS